MHQYVCMCRTVYVCVSHHSPSPPPPLLLQVGQFRDQTYQQYILKALGELVLYVDGMHGLIQCNEIIQWLYELTRSKVGGEGVSGEG